MMRDLIEIVELGNDKQSGLLIAGDVGVDRNCVCAVHDSFASPDMDAANLGHQVKNNFQKILASTLCGMVLLILVFAFLVYRAGRKIAKNVLYNYSYDVYDSKDCFEEKDCFEKLDYLTLLPAADKLEMRGYGANLELINNRIGGACCSNVLKMRDLRDCVEACKCIENAVKSKDFSYLLDSCGVLHNMFDTLDGHDVVCKGDEKFMKMSKSIFESINETTVYIGETYKEFNCKFVDQKLGSQGQHFGPYFMAELKKKNSNFIPTLNGLVKDVRKFLDAVYVREMKEIKFLDTWKIIGNFIVDAQGSGALRPRQNDSFIADDQGSGELRSRQNDSFIADDQGFEELGSCQNNSSLYLD